MVPEHKNPTRSRTSHAPYNFIPLPEKVVTAVPSAEELPNHSSYAPDRYTGHFTVELTTQTPLYIRDLLDQAEFEQKEAEGESAKPFREQIRHKPDFFNVDGSPRIPGSSLRGILRQYVQIVSYGKLQPVTDKGYFFRSMGTSVLARYYRERMRSQGEGEQNNRVKTGFLTYANGEYRIKLCDMVRVPVELIGNRVHENRLPKWSGYAQQHKRGWADIEGKELISPIRNDASGGGREGVLVISGPAAPLRDRFGNVIPKREFFFLLPDAETPAYIVSEETIDTFNGKEQQTQWQGQAFPKNQPRDNSRDINGYLPKPQALKGLGEPVFFTLDDANEIEFLGRARAFRLPYRRRLAAVIPQHLQNPQDIDFAEALFGYLRGKEVDAKQGSKQAGYAGRVMVGDAHLCPNQGNVLEEVFVPKILASPKPTAFQHYLTQEYDELKSLRHYDSRDDYQVPPIRKADAPHSRGDRPNTTVRGFKMYWPQGKRTLNDLRAKSPSEDPTAEPLARNLFEANGQVKANSTQHTQMQPVKAGVNFEFKLYFENLNLAELGALWWALKPNGQQQETYCHRLGMGKPYGMGVVQLAPTLSMAEKGAGERYTAAHFWESFNQQAPETAVPTYEEATAAFEKEVLAQLGLATKTTSLKSVERIQFLLAMMRWQPNLTSEEQDQRRYSSLESFKQSKVLPDPLTLTGVPGVPRLDPNLLALEQVERDEIARKKAERKAQEDERRRAEEKAAELARQRAALALPEIREVKPLQIGDIVDLPIQDIEGQLVMLQIPFELLPKIPFRNERECSLKGSVDSTTLKIGQIVRVKVVEIKLDPDFIEIICQMI